MLPVSTNNVEQLAESQTNSQSPSKPAQSQIPAKENAVGPTSTAGRQVGQETRRGTLLTPLLLVLFDGATNLVQFRGGRLGLVEKMCNELAGRSLKGASEQITYQSPQRPPAITSRTIHERPPLRFTNEQPLVSHHVEQAHDGRVRSRT